LYSKIKKEFSQTVICIPDGFRETELLYNKELRKSIYRPRTEIIKSTGAHQRI
jgi:hypothetical protein